jgi:uncharacterized membrane protein
MILLPQSLLRRHLNTSTRVYIHGWMVLSGIVVFYAGPAYTMFKYCKVEGELSYGKVHV